MSDYTVLRRAATAHRTIVLIPAGTPRGARNDSDATAALLMISA